MAEIEADSISTLCADGKLHPTPSRILHLQHRMYNSHENHYYYIISSIASVRDYSNIHKHSTLPVSAVKRSQNRDKRWLARNFQGHDYPL